MVGVLHEESRGVGGARRGRYVHRRPGHCTRDPCQVRRRVKVRPRAAARQRRVPLESSILARF